MREDFASPEARAEEAMYNDVMARAKGPCAKTTTRCTIITVDGERITGENWCERPQKTCPRIMGEGYEKCKSICEQIGHAEEVAVMLAGSDARGGTAVLSGHTYYCMSCQHALFAAGVVALKLLD